MAKDMGLAALILTSKALPINPVDSITLKVQTMVIWNEVIQYSL